MVDRVIRTIMGADAAFLDDDVSHLCCRRPCQRRSPGWVGPRRADAADCSAADVHDRAWLNGQLFPFGSDSRSWPWPHSLTLGWAFILIAQAMGET
jgi:hypothetical protein